MDQEQWRIQGGRPPPTDKKFPNFMQFLGKSGKFVCWCPAPGGLAPDPTGNPGSAPEEGQGVCTPIDPPMHFVDPLYL